MNAMKMAAAPVVSNNMEIGMDLKTIPNPFFNKFTLKFNLLQDSRVRVNVYNSSGQLKKKVYDNQMKKGSQQFFIGEDNWANGIYFIEIAIDNQTTIRKMSLQR